VNLYGKATPRDTVGLLAALDLGRRADWVVNQFHEFGPASLAGWMLLNRDDNRAQEG
jgi:hypothetical protein